MESDVPDAHADARASGSVILGQMGLVGQVGLVIAQHPPDLPTLSDAPTSPDLPASPDLPDLLHGLQRALEAKS